MANLKFQNALNRVPQACPPIWFMRQAGRYHSHYQDLRKQHSFMDLCRVPELAAEVAMGPIRDFDYDVAILFSDLLFPLEGFGMGLSYNPAPQLDWHLNESTLSKMETNVDTAFKAVEFQYETVKKTREVLPEDKSLIGFVGSPWTLFVYAVVGSHKGDLSALYENMHLFPRFCEVMTPFLVKNIQMQLDAGAEVVMLFDTAAGELTPKDFQNLVVPQLEVITAAHPKKCGYYSKNTNPEHLDHPVFSSFVGIGFDHNWDLKTCFSKFSGFVQGNFFQGHMTLEPEGFKKELDAWLKPLAALSPEERTGWVCGLGHGMIPQAREENVHTFIKTIRETFGE